MTRRTWLKRAGQWLLGLAGLYPLYAFVVSERFRPPEEVRVRGRFKPGKFLTEPRFFLFETEEGPIAVSRRCTHLGCRLNYHESESTFVCPCHQSRFTREGRYLAGPAKKDLPRLGVMLMDGDDGYVIRLPRGA